MSDSHSHAHGHSHSHGPGQSHSHTHGPGGADAHAHDVSKHVKVYIAVFVALLVGTVLTVGMYSVHFESMAVTIVIALFIATVKAFLVAGFFMHLISEKKTIYAVMSATVFFLAAMMFLIIWGRDEVPRGTRYVEGANRQIPVDVIPKK
jgi:cytochrome c oxidase subunit IV